MARTEVPIFGYALDLLSESFAWTDPETREKLERRLSELEAAGIRPKLIAKVDGLAIKIWADEHPPPHFHVEYQGQGASFSIMTCERLRGVAGLEKYEKQIRTWWGFSRSLLIEAWNTSRPTDCPVGPIVDE